MTRKKAWGDQSPTQRMFVVAGAAGELAVQPFGPLAYLAIGRRR